MGLILKGDFKMKQFNNKELLQLIKTDVKGFDKYRAEYKDQKINFRDANLEGANREGAIL